MTIIHSTASAQSRVATLHLFGRELLAFLVVTVAITMPAPHTALEPALCWPRRQDRQPHNRDLLSLSAKTRILQLRSRQIDHRITVCKVRDMEYTRP
jgi:hypothetical protein